MAQDKLTVCSRLVATPGDGGSPSMLAHQFQQGSGPFVPSAPDLLAHDGRVACAQSRSRTDRAHFLGAAREPEAPCCSGRDSATLSDAVRR